MSERKINSFDFFSRIIRERQTGFSSEDAFVFLSLIEIYFNQFIKDEKTDNLKIFDLIPVLSDIQNKDGFSTSLGCAIIYLAGKYRGAKQNESAYDKYNPDMFFSVIGLHWTVAEISEDSRALYPEVHRKAEQVFRLLISNSEAMQSLKTCLSNLKQSSVGNIDIFCPLLSAIVEAPSRPTAETRLAYSTIFKSGVHPVFHMQK